MTPEHLGKLVHQRRKEAGLTQIDLGQTAGVSFHTIRAIEHGKPTVEIGLVLRVLAELGLEVTIT